MSPSSYRRLVKGDPEEDLFLPVKLPTYATPASGQETQETAGLFQLKAVLILSLLLNGATILGVLALYQTINKQRSFAAPHALYSPAQDTVEYETRVFHEGLGADRTIYQMPPSAEVDKAWTDLYNFGVSRVPKSIADRLVNSTYRIPGDESHYVVQLDVFHQLHCLNMLRKALYPDHYPEMRPNPDNLEDQHWNHCIESLRQSLTCSADISPLVWQWVDRAKQVKIAGNIAHTCRNYEKIKQWALERRLDRPLNYAGFV